MITIAAGVYDETQGKALAAEYWQMAHENDLASRLDARVWLLPRCFLHKAALDTYITRYEMAFSYTIPFIIYIAKT